MVDLLLRKVQRLPGLAKSSHLDFLEALDKTYWWLSRNICQFEPPSVSSLSDEEYEQRYEESLTRWINGYLRFRIKDLYQNPSLNQDNLPLDQPIGQNDEGFTWLDLLPATPNAPTLDGLEAYLEQLQTENTERIFREFEIYVEQDLERRLRDCHPRHHPDCNCRMLCQKVLLQNPPEKFSVLSRKFEIGYQTLVTHWKRKCKPLLQEILLELGYCPSSISS
ncbi:MAG: hypothetical protein AAFO04_28500 [Cyanobacteria bacterium J06592_8]